MTASTTSPVPSNVLKSRDLICFSNDWHGDPLSKTHLMRILARDNRVLWINSIGYRSPSATKADLSRALNKLRRFFTPVHEVEPNLFVLNPLAAPFYGTVGRFLNGYLLKTQILRVTRRLRYQQPITWAFLPGAAVVAGRLGESALIYYCVDEFSAFTGVSSQAISELEADLLTRSDLVIVSSERLRQSKASANRNTHLIRHGVDFDHFRRALEPDTTVPPAIADLPRPILGYFGLIADDWIDLDLLSYVAKRFSNGSLVMLGKITMDVTRLASLPNVHFLGRQPYADLPAFCRGFDVGLIPFPVTELTLNANPLKAREYLAAGLPVITTPIPEVGILPHCRIGQNPEAFASAIESALEDPGPKIERSESIRPESWQARIDEIARILGTTL